MTTKVPGFTWSTIVILAFAGVGGYWLGVELPVVLFPDPDHGIFGAMFTVIRLLFRWCVLGPCAAFVSMMLALLMTNWPRRNVGKE